MEDHEGLRADASARGDSIDAVDEDESLSLMPNASENLRRGLQDTDSWISSRFWASGRRTAAVALLACVLVMMHTHLVREGEDGATGEDMVIGRVSFGSDDMQPGIEGRRRSPAKITPTVPRTAAPTGWPTTAPTRLPPRRHHFRGDLSKLTFNESFAYCRDYEHNRAPRLVTRPEDLPPDCPRDSFAIPIGDGGLNNVVQRLYHALTMIKRTKKYTVLMPHVRNHPGRFTPHAGLGPSRYIPFREVFNETSYCLHLQDIGICSLCRYDPPTYPELASTAPDQVLAALHRISDPPHAGHDREILAFARSNKRVVFVSGDTYPDESPEFFHYMVSLRPNARVAHVVGKTLRTVGEQPYVSVHMRIEQDWKAFKRGHYYVDADTIVQLVVKNPKFKELLAQSRAHGDGALALFIASGAKELARNAWGKAGVKVRFIESSEEDLDHHQLSWIARSLVDFLVAKDGDMFVGTAMWSSFSSNIVLYRYLEAQCLAAAIRSSALRGGEQRQYSSSAFAYHRNADWGNVDELLACKIMCWGAETTKNRLG